MQDESTDPDQSLDSANGPGDLFRGGGVNCVPIWDIDSIVGAQRRFDVACVLPLLLADVRHPSRVMEVEFEGYGQLDGRDVCGLHVMRMGCRYQESEEVVPANDAGEGILENSYAGDPSLILRRGPSQR